MRLCTFEVATHLGRHCRVGAFKDGRVIDVNFATAWYLEQQGESEPQQLANALCPPSMLDFLRAGLRATHTAEDLFLGSGPNPTDWWKIECPPRGPNDETLVYSPDQVRLRAPLPIAFRLGTDEDLRSTGAIAPELKLAAVIGKKGANIGAMEARGHIAGYTAMNDLCARYSALGPYLATPDEIVDPYALGIAVRINGKERAQMTSERLRPKFEDTIEALSASGVILPGDVLSIKIPVELNVNAGDIIELEIEKIGTLRTRVV